MLRISFILLAFIPNLLMAYHIERAIFAGGCFWCMQADFEHYQQEHDNSGISNVVAGYDGGMIEKPTYKLVSSGKTLYKEVVEVTFNPDIISYEKLVKFFFLHIDPTVKNRQFCDIGKQYASAIYYTSDRQKQIAEKVLKQVSQTLNKPIYTEILPSTTFYKAETYHQQYYKKNPIRYKYYRWNCGRDQTIQRVWGDKSL